MKKLIFTLLLLVVGSSAFSADKENVLEAWTSAYLHSHDAVKSPVAVTADLKTIGGQHFLAFRVTNISGRSIKIYPSFLPWGNPYTITLAAFTTDGKALQNIYPIDDPAFKYPINIAPGQIIRGSY